MPWVLTDKARALLEQLYKPQPFWKSSTKHKLSLLKSLAHVADPAAILEIPPLLLDNNEEVARSAANTVLALSEPLRSSDFRWLDHAMRERSPYRWAYLLIKASNDHFGPVRKNAVNLMCERFLELASQWLERALLDAHPSVRGYAQFRLMENLAFDIRTFYVDAVSQPSSPSLFSALSGLGEAGETTDASLAEQYTAHAEAKIRRAALRTLGRLNAREYVDVFLSGLGDRSSSVLREATRALSRVVHLLDGQRLWNALGNGSEPHVRRHALFLLARLGKWESISYMLEASSTNDDHLRALALTYVRRWLKQSNSNFASPTQQQIARLHAALDRHGSNLENSLLKELRFTLKAL